MYDLGTPPPASKSLVVRMLKEVSFSQRSKALRETEYNIFSFPADLLTLDFLSDSGTTSMTDFQWSSLLLGDSSYGRNKGYYVLLDAIRDTFERGNKKKQVLKLIQTDEQNIDQLLDEIYLAQEEGGFVNGGLFQLKRPNAFIVPQGRCAEYLLFSTISELLRKLPDDKEYCIPSNGHFDTTEAHIRANAFKPVNLFSESLLDYFPYSEMDVRNPFKGNMNIDALRSLIEEKGAESIPLIYLTITNNTAGGQPVSLANMKEVKEVANAHDIPFFFDACRFAENAYFIKEFEEGFRSSSISAIIQKMFAYVDGFSISFKKDGLANMGGGLFFRDKGVFHRKYSFDGDVGIRLKEKQILTFGNDSYGGMSGRDIMALAVGLYEIVKESYMHNRIHQVREFARKLAERNIPVLLPAGGHAVYLNMNEFFSGTDMSPEDFGGVGFTIELLRHYGIRACELGPFAFEWDQKTEEERGGILNLVRFAVPRNAYRSDHIDYTVAAIDELFRHRDEIPKVRITRGSSLRLRHFQTGLEPIFEKNDKKRIDLLTT